MRYYDGVRLEGKVSVVTGASRGIGFAVSKIFALNKMRVCMVARDQKRLEEAARCIRGEVGSEDSPYAIAADITREDDVREIFSDVMDREGRIDILVNNAGVGVFKPFLETSPEDLRETFKVNVEGTFLCCKEAFRIMKDQGGGFIVNLGSIVSLEGYENQSVYTASKHAVIGLTKVLAKEGRDYNIRVVTVCPGGVRTDMAEEQRKAIRPDLLPDELMDPEDVAHAILFMLSFSDKAAVDNLVIRRKWAPPRF